MDVRAVLGGVVALIAAVGGAGCSLAGLASYDVARCDEHDACPGLNARDGIAETACARWNCEPVSRACVFGPRDLDGDGDPDPACTPNGRDCDDRDGARRSGLDETCDGLDNDCDDPVDEDVVGPRGEPRALVAVEVPSTPRGTFSAHGGALVLIDGAEASVVRLDDTVPTLRAITHAMPVPGATLAATDWTSTLSTEGCPRATASSFEARPCDEAGVALDLGADGRGLLAFVSDLDARAGLLRVAPFDPSTGVARHQSGPSPSDLWLGVDASGDRTGTTGASEPSIVLGEDGVALLTYLRAGVHDADGLACRDGVDLEVAALAVEQTSFTSAGATLTLARSSGGAAPAVLGHTGTFVPPEIVALPGSGFLALSPAPASGLALAVVRAGSPALSITPRALHLPGEVAYRAVRAALAPGRTPGTLDLGLVLLAARDGAGACGAVAPLTFVVVRDVLGAASVDPEPYALGTGADPSIVFVASGIEAGAGGWIVAWTDRNEVRGRRFAAGSGLPADTDPFALGAGFRLTSLRSTPAVVAFAYVRDPDVVVGELCGR